MRIKPLDIFQLAVTVYGLFRKKPSKTAELIAGELEARSQAAGYEWARKHIMEENKSLFEVRAMLYRTNVGASFETGALDYIEAFDSLYNSKAATKSVPKMHSNLSDSLEPTDET